MADKTFDLSLVISATATRAFGTARALERAFKRTASSGRSVGRGLGMLGDVGSGAFSAITGGIGMAAKAIRTVLGGAISFATRGLKLLGLAGATAVGAVWAGLKAMRPSSAIEQYGIQFEVLLKSATAAKARVAELFDIASRTPVTTPEAFEAGALMEAFGIYSKKGFMLAADTAKTFGKSVTEVVRSLGYLSSGRAGEAMESLMRVGITRAKLKPFGVEFSKAGSLVTPVAAAMEAVFAYMEANYGGMLTRMGTTFKGALSNIGSAWFKFWADAGKGMLRYVTPAINTVTALINRMAERVGTVDFSKFGMGLLTGVKAASSFLEDMLDPQKRAGVADAFKASIEGAFDQPFEQIIGKFKELPEMFARDIGTVLGTFIGNFTKIAVGFWEVGKSAFVYGASLISEALEAGAVAIGTEVSMRIGKTFEGLPGKIARIGLKAGQGGLGAVATAADKLIGKPVGGAIVQAEKEGFSAASLAARLLPNLTERSRERVEAAETMPELSLAIESKTFAKHVQSAYDRAYRDFLGWSPKAAGAQISDTAKTSNAFSAAQQKFQEITADMPKLETLEFGRKFKDGLVGAATQLVGNYRALAKTEAIAPDGPPAPTLADKARARREEIMADGGPMAAALERAITKARTVDVGGGMTGIGRTLDKVLPGILLKHDPKFMDQILGAPPPKREGFVPASERHMPIDPARVSAAITEAFMKMGELLKPSAPAVITPPTAMAPPTAPDPLAGFVSAEDRSPDIVGAIDRSANTIAQSTVDVGGGMTGIGRTLDKVLPGLLMKHDPKFMDQILGAPPPKREGFVPASERHMPIDPARVSAAIMSAFT
ncbi:MAG: hypothetical protein GY851_35760, partial [bacterium]|nr:hypothetical protein [bacterium]